MSIIPAGMFKREVEVEEEIPERAAKWCKRCGRKHNPKARCKALRKVRDLTVVHPCVSCGEQHTEPNEDCPDISTSGTKVGSYTTRPKETDETGD